mmetsp:Transcript_9390/g.14053  ORF Transcript_9390/g.14053 Transcript_9390/m.14053 type:complete len:173 (+) Transcript_9390:80-598(+)|eukprot:CAMPEP_0194083380 /NCGR_PEP_ID=MMETSP0149-20130528/9120_1 /TAXON_ID=122233 /ORGANISM="Chaetoceros debilis, Strain MM31A-1" /LENGTH=172 /DNA_ID=CAMNT_0038765775 /DNA_START=63 /DNA_END=581 /DNA_ORIENTATION=+
MKIQSLCLILAVVASAVDAFTTNSASKYRPPRALISRRTTALKAAEGAPAKKKKAVKKKTVKKKAPAKAAVAEKETVETFRKPEFVGSIAEKTGMSKQDSEAALAAVLETISENVAAGKRISMLGFGTFKLTRRKARKGRNPKTGEEIDIKASNSPSFSAGKAFKERCNPNK